MPKKFGTNSKKEEAKEKENQKKKDTRERQEAELENQYWRETDDKVLSKLKKEEEKEKKRLETIKRKQENKELADKEIEEIIKAKQPERKAPTRGEIEDYKLKAIEKLVKQYETQTSKVEETIKIDIEKEFVNENFGKLNPKTSGGADVIDISGVNDALEQLNFTEYDKHPEKRMRAAWNDFFEMKLPEYKKEYPSLKRSQLIVMIQKEFKKSPENPVYKQQLMNANKSNLNKNEDDEFDNN